MLWVAVYFPLLPLEVQPGFSVAQPQAVQQQQQIVIANAIARTLGIRAGMKSVTAQALCDVLTLYPHDYQAEQSCLQQLARSLLFLTPAVSLDNPHTVLLDISTSLKLFQGPRRLLQHLQQHLDSLPHDWQIGIGHTPLAAQLLVHQLNTCPDDDIGKLRHLCLQALRDVPLAHLPLENKLRQTLSAPGFTVLGQLLDIPRTLQGKRFGRDWLDWLARLLGEKPDPRTAIDTPERFHADVEFAEPIEHIQGLLFPAQRLLEKLDAFLATRQLHSKAIRWRFLHAGQPDTRILIRRASDHEDSGLWLALTRRHFENLQLAAPVQALALDCARPLPRRSAVASLFSDPLQRPVAATLLERLATLPALSMDTLHPVAAHVPEQAQTQRNAMHESCNRKTGEDAFPLTGFHDLPLWLLPRPLPLAGHDQQPVWRGAPLALLPNEQWLHSDWWQQPTTRRYVIGKHPAGICCWLFQDANDRWFLHGFF